MSTEDAGSTELSLTVPLPISLEDGVETAESRVIPGHDISSKNANPNPSLILMYIVQNGSLHLTRTQIIGVLGKPGWNEI
jgi:hypothetical protein